MVKDFPNYTDKSILIVGCSLLCNKTTTKHISKPMLIHNKVDNKQHLSLLDCFLYIYEQWSLQKYIFLHNSKFI
jgi:hypothetical protein